MRSDSVPGQGRAPASVTVRAVSSPGKAIGPVDAAWGCWKAGRSQRTSPRATSAAVGAVLAIFTGCVRIKDVFAEMDWGVVFLLAGTIPLGVALDETGASSWIAALLADNLQGPSPVFVVAVFYLVTTLLTEIMSNNATAVVLTPIAIQTGAALEMHPLALLVAVMFGASASFMTPVGYQTNAMVYGPGGYRFTDFLRVGAPLSAILVVLVSVLIQFFWPS